MAFLCSSAHGAPGPERTAHFLADGKNETATSYVETAQHSTCNLTVVNVSPNPQNVKLSEITATANGSAASKVEGPSLGNITVLAAGSSVSWSFRFPAIPAGTPTKQDLICKGKFAVADTNAESPGFVLANGTLGTFTEDTTRHMVYQDGTTGEAKINTTVSAHQSPIVIREGTPF